MIDDNQVWPTEESPCTGVCQCDVKDVCIGCGRSRQEIAMWIQMSNDERRACKKRCTTRLTQLHDDDRD